MAGAATAGECDLNCKDVGASMAELKAAAPLPDPAGTPATLRWVFERLTSFLRPVYEHSLLFML